MYTNEEIRSSMQDLVDKKCPDHRGPSRYANNDGTGACFLGALCEQMGVAVPRSLTLATAVLGEGEVSMNMEVAFSVAQQMNDTGIRWGLILEAVDSILALDESGLYQGNACPCGCTGSSLSDDIIAIMMHARFVDSFEKQFKSIMHCPVFQQKDHALVA